MEFIENSYFLLTLTFAIYILAGKAQQKTHLLVLNPVLATIAFMIVFLVANDISYETYFEGGQYINFWLKPAIVALGIPLYKQLHIIRKQMLPVLLSTLGGCIAGIVSVVLVADWCGASREIVMTLAPKSVTTPIAMEITAPLGGIPSLTAAIVISVGIFGAIIGIWIMRLMGIKSAVAHGISLGTAAHAVGTSRAVLLSERYGAFSSLGLILNGVFTAILTPIVLDIMGYL